MPGCGGEEAVDVWGAEPGVLDRDPAVALDEDDQHVLATQSRQQVAAGGPGIPVMGQRLVEGRPVAELRADLVHLTGHQRRRRVSRPPGIPPTRAPPRPAAAQITARPTTTAVQARGADRTVLRRVLERPTRRTARRCRGRPRPGSLPVRRRSPFVVPAQRGVQQIHAGAEVARIGHRVERAVERLVEAEVEQAHRPRRPKPAARRRPRPRPVPRPRAAPGKRQEDDQLHRDPEQHAAAVTCLGSLRAGPARPRSAPAR